jgi:predicted naringenin-chalcone synthase
MTTPTPDAKKRALAIWYVAQRVLRTIVQVGIPAFLTFALVLPQIIEALGLPADSRLRLWLLAVAAIVTAVAAALTRLMAIPAVNSWLTKIGLGSVPASAIRTDIAGTFVKRDPKLPADPIVTSGVDVEHVADQSTQQRYPLHGDN